MQVDAGSSSAEGQLPEDCQSVLFTAGSLVLRAAVGAQLILDRCLNTDNEDTSGQVLTIQWSV